MAEEYLIYFARMIENEIGIIYSDSNFFQLQNRLEQIAKTLGHETVQELYQSVRLAPNHQMKQLLLDVATNNETSFFRDPKIFHALQSTIFPKFLKEKTVVKTAENSLGNNLRIWSGACSSGQEAYSLGMILSELNAPSITPVEIVCTDISTRALEKATQATYSSLEVSRGLSPELKAKYFAQDPDGNWKVRPELRSLAQFKMLNLLDPFESLGTFDLICCRNVLIYQNVERKKIILAKLRKQLRPDGYLILGSGESMIGLTEEFEIEKIGEVIVYKGQRTG